MRLNNVDNILVVITPIRCCAKFCLVLIECHYVNGFCCTLYNIMLYLPNEASKDNTRYVVFL